MRIGVVRGRRSRAQWTILSALALLGLVIGGVGAGLNGYLAAATDAGVRTTLAENASADAGFEVSTRAGDDLAAQDTAVTERLAELLPNARYDLHPSTIAGSRSFFDGPDGRPASDADDDADAGDADDDAEVALGLAVLAAYPDLAHHTELVDGEWPDQADVRNAFPVALHARPAAELGLSLGDLFSFSDRGEPVAFEVVGLWLPTDPAEPYWYGEPLEVDGADGDVDLLAVVTETDLATVPGARLTSRWRLDPDLEQVRATDVAAMRSALPRVANRLAADIRLESQINVDDGMLDVLRESDDRIQAARSVAMVPLVLFGVISVIALALVARLLAALRSTETALLRARGATPSRLTRWALREGVVAVAVPAAAGGVAAWFVLPALADIGTEVTIFPLVVGAAAAALLGVLTVTVVAGRSAGATVEATVMQRAASARRQSLLRAGTGLVAVVAAVVTIWQLRRYGSPAVADATGVSRIDPLAVAAPAAALLAGGVLAAVFVAAVAWAAQRLAAGRSGLGAVLAIRQVARRPAAYALPVALVVLAAGGGTLAAAFAGTWTDLQRDAAAQRTGADVQVVLRPGPPLSASPQPHGVSLEAYREIDGVRSATPVLVAPRARVSDGAVELIAMPAGDQPAEVPGVELPEGSQSVEVEIELDYRAELNQELVDAFGEELEDVDDPDPADVRIPMWFADADGVVSLVQLDIQDVMPGLGRTTHQLAAELPDGAEPWQLIGAEVQVRGSSSGFFGAWAYDYDIQVTALRTNPGGIEADLDQAGGWSNPSSEPQLQRFPDVAIESIPAGLGLRIDSHGQSWDGRVTERFLPGERDLDPETADPVPVVATADALSRFGLSVGDEATLRVGAADLNVRITESVGAVPGTASALVFLADLADLTNAVLASNDRMLVPNRIWVDADPAPLADGAVAAAAAEVGGSGVEVLDQLAIEQELRGNAFAGLSLVAFWVVAGAAVLLAGAGLAAGATVLSRQRSGELAVLRSLGFSSRQQARSRRREQGLIIAVALVIGGAAGWLVAYLTAGVLASAATPSQVENLQPVLRLANGPWAATLVAVLAAGIVVVTTHGARVRRQADAAPAPGRWS